MKQQYLPESGHLATPGHVPLAVVKVVSPVRYKGPWQLW